MEGVATAMTPNAAAIPFIHELNFGSILLSYSSVKPKLGTPDFAPVKARLEIGEAAVDAQRFAPEIATISQCRRAGRLPVGDSYVKEMAGIVDEIGITDDREVCRRADPLVSRRERQLDRAAPAIRIAVIRAGPIAVTTAIDMIGERARIVLIGHGGSERRELRRPYLAKPRGGIVQIFLDRRAA